MLCECTCGIRTRVKELGLCECGKPHKAGTVRKEVYVAASFTRKYEAMLLAKVFKDNGWVINSTWFKYNEDSEEEAMRDVKDVLRSDLVCVLTGDTESHGGRHTECGIAIGAGIDVVRVGPHEQIFHHIIPEIDVHEYARVYAKRYV